MIFSKAEAWEKSGRTDLAISEYTMMIEAHEGGADALIRRSILRRELGALIEAQADLERAAAVAPSNPYPMMRLGELAHAAGRNIKAAEWQRAALARAPESDEMRVNAAAACMHVDWLDLAYAAAKPLQENLSDWWAATRSKALERYPQARAEALATLRSRRSATDPIEWKWALIQQLFRVGRLTSAKSLCEWLMRDRPHSFPVFAMYIRIIARENGPETAVSFLEAHAWLHRADPEYVYLLARMNQEAGRYAEVLRLSSAVPIDEQNEDWRYTTSIATMMLGETDALNDYCGAWSEAAPRSITPPGFLCSAHFRSMLNENDHAGELQSRPISLFHFWDSRDVPDDVREVTGSWLAHHPSIRQHVFNEEEAHDYICRHYGNEAVSAFAGCSHAAMKADLFRVAYLAQDGGVWVDADEFCLRSIPELLTAAASSEATAVLSGDAPAYLHNFFLGARAGSRVMLDAFQDAVAAVAAHAHEGRRPNIWEVTGPGLITRAVGRRLASGSAEERSSIRLLALTHYRSFARNRSDLAYKRSTEGNWQLL